MRPASPALGAGASFSGRRFWIRDLHHDSLNRLLHSLPDGLLHRALYILVIEFYVGVFPRDLLYDSLQNRAHWRES